MLKSAWVLLAGFGLVVGLAAVTAGRWHPVHTILAVMGGTCVGLTALAVGATASPRLSGGPTARQVRSRAAALAATHPEDTPAELAARVRAWYGGGRVARTPGADLNACLFLPVLLPVWLVRDALVATTPDEFDQPVSDAVTAATGQPPPLDRRW